MFTWFAHADYPKTTFSFVVMFVCLRYEMYPNMFLNDL